MQPFEIGIVYKKYSRYYLAIAPALLITFVDGCAKEVRPHSPNYEAERSITVDDLCKVWHISLDDLDRMTAKFLPAPQDSIKSAPRGSRRAKQLNNELIWKEIRSARLPVSPSG